MKRNIFLLIFTISQLSYSQYLLTDGSNKMTGGLNIERQGYSSIELKSNTGSFIDFHSSISSDFDGRIIWNYNNSNQFDVYGTTRFINNISWGNSGASLTTNQGAAIELRGTGTPFFDFSNDSDIDYDIRMILVNDNLLQITGGNVGIGTSTTGSHKLAVEGSIGAREIKVEASGWSDFVFDKEYHLKPLEEIEVYITKNNHLPEIPSEKEVKKNGINLGEMDAKLLQKIEELTLYLIEQNKKIKNLQKEIASLKNK